MFRVALKRVLAILTAVCVLSQVPPLKGGRPQKKEEEGFNICVSSNFEEGLESFPATRPTRPFKKAIPGPDVSSASPALPSCSSAIFGPDSRTEVRHETNRRPLFFIFMIDEAFFFCVSVDFAVCLKLLLAFRAFQRMLFKM